MIKFRDILLERIDYLATAESLIRQYKLKSKVKFSSGKDKADYDWIDDIVYLRPSNPSVRDFLFTVLHEIHHALRRKKLGAKKYEKQYQQAGNIALQQGKDFYDDNKFEISANNWAKRELPKVINSI